MSGTDLTLSPGDGAAVTSPVAADALASKTVIGAAWLMAWRVVSRVLGLFSTLVLARVLVPGDFGLVAMATTFAATVDYLSEVGLQNALVRHPANDRSLFDTAFTLQAGRAAGTALIIAGGAPWAANWFHEPKLLPMLLVLAAASMVTGLENIGIVEFRRAMRYDTQFKLMSVPRLVQVAITIPAALILQSYWALMLGIVVSKVVRTAMSYAVHPYRPRWRLTGWRELAGFSFWTWAACIAGLIWTRVDPFVLGPIVGPAALGVYLLALELGTLPITEIIEPVADALFTGFASAQKETGSSVHHAPLVAATLVMVVMPLTITVSCASGYVVAGLLGPKWAEANALIAIVGWLCLFSPLTFVGSAVLIANGHVRRNFIGKLIAAVVRFAILVTAVTWTTRLDYLSGVVTLCVVIESVAFVGLLVGLPGVRLRPVAGALARTLLAGAAVVAVLDAAGLAWRDVAMPSLPALACAAGVGLLVVVVFSGFLWALWALAGRPDGPETRAAGMALVHARPVLARFGTAFVRAPHPGPHPLRGSGLPRERG